MKISTVDNSQVFYARTYNWSSTEVFSPTVQTTQFSPPPSLVLGTTYNLQVVTNGIPSRTVTFVYSKASSVGNVPAPANLEFLAGNNGQVALAWMGSKGATSYNVQRLRTSTGETENVSVTGTSYTDTALVGAQYQYVVTAVGPGGESGPSNLVVVTPGSGALSNPGAFFEWVKRSGSALNSAFASINLSSSQDGDGLSTLLKYATNTPLGTSSRGPTTLSGVNGNLNLTFQRPDPAPVSYIVEDSTDLNSWTTVASLATGSSSWHGPTGSPLTQGISTVLNSTSSTATVTVTDPNPISLASRRFLRLRVTTAPP